MRLDCHAGTENCVSKYLGSKLRKQEKERTCKTLAITVRVYIGDFKTEATVPNIAEIEKGRTCITLATAVRVYIGDFTAEATVPHRTETGRTLVSTVR